MVVLLVAHHVYHLVNGVVLEAHLGRADVLGHVDAGAVRAQQQLLVKPFGGQIRPHAVVGMAFEETFLQPLLHLGLAFEVGVRLIIDLVEAHSESLIGLVKAGIHPLVHALPKVSHLRVALFPLHEHLVSFLNQRCVVLGQLLRFLVRHAFGLILGLQFLHLLAVVLVKGHVVIANEVVSLLSAALRGLAVAPLEPCEHRLADVYATVVHYIGLDYAVAVGLHNLRKRPSEQVVAHVSEMQGLVCVGRRVLYHHQRRRFGGLLLAKLGVRVDVCEQRSPRFLRYNEVEEALNHVERVHSLAVCHEVVAYLLCSVLGLLPRNLQEREHYECEIALKLALCLLQLHRLFRHILTVQSLHSRQYGFCYRRFDIHCYTLLYYIWAAKLQKKRRTAISPRRFLIREARQSLPQSHLAGTSQIQACAYIQGFEYPRHSGKGDAAPAFQP